MLVNDSNGFYDVFALILLFSFLDSQVQKASQTEELSCTGIASKSLDHLLLVPPTYMVGSDVLRPNSQSYTSLLAQDYGQFWQKSFSNFLVLSSLFAEVSASNEPFLHGTEARIEVHSDWNWESSYFHSRNGRVVCEMVQYISL